MARVVGTPGPKAHGADHEGGGLTRDGATIEVRVLPRVPRDQVMGFRGDVLQVRVAAPPERGKAHEALVKLLAEVMGTRRSEVRVVRGHTSRTKLVAVDGISPDDLRRRLGVQGSQ